MRINATPTSGLDVDPMNEVIKVRDNKNATIYRITQYIGGAIINQVATTPTLGSYGFTISELDQFSSFSAIWDQYRITKIDVTFSPMYRGTPIQATNNVVIPYIYVAVDYDDVSTPSSIATLREYQNCIVRNDEKSFTVSFKPSVALAAYSGSFTSYANVSEQWLDMASSGVVHYGIKYAVDPGWSGQTNFQSWNVNYRFWVEFKNVR